MEIYFYMEIWRMRPRLCLLLIVLLASCSNSEEDAIIDVPPEKQNINFNYVFSDSEQDFQISATDYLVGDEEYMELDLAHTQLPNPYQEQKGFLFTWANNTADIKGFVKRKITGLRAGGSFEITFSVDVLSNISEECGGIGGAPGESIQVKGALLPDEPIRIIEPISRTVSESDIYRISIDDGQSGGADVALLGHIGLKTDCQLDNAPWQFKKLTNSTEQYYATADSLGTAWIYISIDSGFEGKSTFYLTEVKVNVVEL
jgi:hypothetical protein